jgi:bacterioferritin (cytochrome b1)
VQFQTGTQISQGVMQQPPEIVTTKDLSYLEDALSWELLAAKKFAMYAQMAQEQGVKDICDRLSKMHQTHYMTLLKHVDPAKAMPTQPLTQ